MAINERLIHTAADAAAGGGTGNQEEGLILHLDANDIDSYDGDGDIWYDITNHEYTPAVNPAENFNTVLYTGQGTSQTITADTIGFQPDLVWLKNRDGVYSHRIFDTVRGANERLLPDSTSAESTRSGSFSELSSFSDGFTLDPNNRGVSNSSADDYVAWCFKAGGATDSTNIISIDGTQYTNYADAGLTQHSSAPSQEVSVNTKLGFSIVKANSVSVNHNNKKLTHGLGQEPEMSIYKFTSTTSSWYTYHKDVGKDRYLVLNATDAQSSSFSGRFFSDSNHQNALLDSSSRDFVIYNFVSKRGVSKVGSYTGTGTSGNKIYTGFQPAWVLIKNTSGTGNWMIYDIKRDTDGTINKFLEANTSDAEASASTATVSPNADGFTLGNSNSVHLNQSGNNFIYLAFAAEKPSSLIDDTDLEQHLDPASYSGSGTTWTADTGSNATVVASRYDEELGDSFDISTDGESTIQIASGHPLNDNSFTLEFWFNWKSTPSAANRFIYESSGGWNFFYYSGLGWRINNSDVATGYFSNGNFITVGQWYHCVIAQDSSNCKIYFDGELVKTQSVTSGTRSLGAFNFGTTYITADKPKCDIGQIRMYSSALTADEVMQNYRFTKNDYPNGIHFTGNNISSSDWNSSGYFDLDGSSEYFETSGNPSALINATNFTFQTWVKMHTTGTTDYIASQTTADGNTQNWLLRFNSDNTIKFYVYGTDEYLSTTSTYSANTWYHIAGVVEDDGTVKIYVNGTLEASSSSGKSADTTSYNTFIGSLGGSSTGRFDGDIGAVKYYSKALTASELLADYNATKSTYGL